MTRYEKLEMLYDQYVDKARNEKDSSKRASYCADVEILMHKMNSLSIEQAQEEI